MKNPKEDNSNYTDGFPVGDDEKKKDGITSNDSSRPFDSGRPNDKRGKSGTTLDNPPPNKDKNKK